MASAGTGKRSASAAELDDYNNLNPYLGDDDPCSASGIPLDNDSNKRARYPDPTPYQNISLPHGLPGYDYQQPPNYYDNNQSSSDSLGQALGFHNSLAQDYQFSPMPSFQPLNSSPYAPYNSPPQGSSFTASSPYGLALPNDQPEQTQPTQDSQQIDARPRKKPRQTLAFPQPPSGSVSTPTVSNAALISPPVQPAQPPQPAATRNRGRNGKLTLGGPLRVGGVGIEDAGLKVPDDVPEAEAHRRRSALLQEIDRQRQHPPALPRSQIIDLEEKPRHAPWREIPDDCSQEERDRLQLLNNTIAAENQKIERDRNNQAAKKSRQKRLEALNNTRVLLNDKAAECDWWRMRAITLGALAREWEQIPRQVRSAMIQEISDRVDVIHQRHEEEKKKEDAIKRTQRNKTRTTKRAPQASTPSSSP